jgi:hypothetical protein
LARGFGEAAGLDNLDENRHFTEQRQWKIYAHSATVL